jgi:DNA-directed RNA polymerase subunit RPC12/RpoP
VSWYFKIPIAIAAGWYIFKMGRAMIGGLARPIPAPPPDGELRRVNMRYRCLSCGTEIRMVKTDVTDPIPPRHCMDEMELIQVDGEAVEGDPGFGSEAADSDGPSVPAENE